ncbi:DUF6113 family protein [Streptomyces sp. NPDC002138]|uniref:DUF6113 family protein n=1 Tax=Streptomyces sp. NPDC002138 TaxID=3154410 RepID=UPI003318F817
MTTTWTPARIVALVVLLVLGALTGVAGWLVVGLWFPGGLVLALLALLGLFLAGRLVTGSGIGVGVPVVGWFLAYVMLGVPRAEGDFLLSSSGIGMYVYLFGGVVLAVMCATLRGPLERPVSAGRPGR